MLLYYLLSVLVSLNTHAAEATNIESSINELVIAQLPAGNYIAVIKENGKAVYQSRFVKE